MKRVVLSIIFVSFCIFSFTQVPESFSYQAIIRDGGATVSEQSVFYRFSIIKGELPGEVVYTEKHNPVTSEIGLVTLAIGKGTDKSGVFTTIDWGADIYSLNVELDMEGDGSYADMGTTQLLSVPYAMHSKTATSYTETDPLFGGWNKSTDISITASQVSDFQSSVTDNPAVIANTAKNSYPAADAEKLATIAAGAEVNVNADWDATTGDAQIMNKPTTIEGYGITDAVLLTGDQTIAGNKTFTSTTTVPTPVNATDAATKAYVDGLIEQLYGFGGLKIKDIDGNYYNTIKIGYQIWMAENLTTTKYNDGTEIPNITDDDEWAELTTGAYSDYSNSPANSTTYGRLYNWYAVDNNAATK